MANQESLQLFEGKNVRMVWDEEQEKWYFSIVDVVAMLTDSIDYQAARNYWKVLKNRLTKEGNQTVTNCNQLNPLANAHTEHTNKRGIQPASLLAWLAVSLFFL